VWLWPMDGSAKTSETFVRTVSDTNFEIRGLGDQTGDGKADILWRNKTNGQIYLWPMDGSTPLDEIYVGTVGTDYDIVGAGDLDGDGKSDLLWRNTTLGDVWVWLMDGATPLGRTYVGRVDPAYIVKGVGDLDADGKADIVWHGAAGDVWVWPMDGATRLSQAYVGAVPDVGYQIVGVADHTGDGKADLLWRHATRGEAWIWTMDGPARTAETWVGTVRDTDYRVVATGDYDGDGKADILWHHATRGEVWVWLMDGATKRSETWVGSVPDVGYQIVTGTQTEAVPPLPALGLGTIGAFGPPMSQTEVLASAFSATVFTTLEFAEEYGGASPALVTEAGERILGTQGGGSGVFAAAFSYDVLNRLEGAAFLKSGVEIDYADPAGKRTGYLILIGGTKLGVMVVRAAPFPAGTVYTEAMAQAMLTQKLQDIQLSSANVASADRWAKQVLHVFADSQDTALALLSALDSIDAGVKANTVVYITRTDGADSFIYY